MLRTQNITGPTNSNTTGYNNSVNAINKMQKEEAEELDKELSRENTQRLLFLNAYSTYTQQRYTLSIKINQINGLIKEF